MEFLLYVPYARKLDSKKRPHILMFSQTTSGFTMGPEIRQSPARFQDLPTFLLTIKKKSSLSPTPSSLPHLGLSCGISKHFLMNLDKTRTIKDMENWNVVS